MVKNWQSWLMWEKANAIFGCHLGWFIDVYTQESCLMIFGGGLLLGLPCYYILVIYSNMANHYITILYHNYPVVNNSCSSMIRAVATLVYPLWIIIIIKHSTGSPKKTALEATLVIYPLGISKKIKKIIIIIHSTGSPKKSQFGGSKDVWAPDE